MKECFILGNGPSLKNVPNVLLDKLPTFGTNRIYLKYTPSYYFCVNPLIAEQSKAEIEKLDSIKYVTEFVDIPGCQKLRSESPSFSFFPFLSVHEGGTVLSVCFQFAYWLGYTRVFLLGLDHDYAVVSEPNEEVIWSGEDVNHFASDYMKPGERWHSPDLWACEQTFAAIKDVFYADGREIINLTKNTKLDVFVRGNICDYFDVQV